MVTNIFKPSAMLGSDVGELKALSKDFSKDDAVIIVGGPGNSLGRDPNYNTENDVDNIAKSSTHTSVGFVGLLELHDRPYMSKWVMSADMRLEHALWNADRLINVLSVDRYDHNRRGMHLSLRGKEKLV
jgi:hypothetical protein